MGYTCDVPNCDYKSKTGIPLFKLPNVSQNLKSCNKKFLNRQKEAWLLALKVRKSRKQLHVCGKHFVKGKPAHYKQVNDCDWTPSQHMGYQKPICVPHVEFKRKSGRKTTAENSSTSISINLSTDEEVLLCSTEMEDRSTANISSTSDNPDALGSVPLIAETCTGKNVCSVGIQTDMTANYISAMESELNKRNSELYALRNQVEELSWTEKTFENNPSKIKYFTGLPNLNVLLLLLSYMSDSLNVLKVGKLSNFQKFLLLLMKLRHNTTFIGLGYRFGITAKEASYIFKNLVVIFHDTFSYVIHWPDRESLRAKVPKCFKDQYGDKVTVIIDCFEVRSEKPSAIRARAQIHSNYKGGPTDKYLIGITVHGFICFISDGYGGRVSDKFITEDCGILDNLIPGDMVLADRGFTVSELVAMKHATLNIPAFTRGLKQLHPVDIEKTRKIASVRIHVERIIGLLRNKFYILKHVVPITFLKDRHNDKSLFDIIVKSCCILVNLSESVIPLENSRKTNLSS